MNEHNMHPLTKAQSDFAAKNYELVFTFLFERKLDADEYHDAVIMSYLMAVQVYHEHPNAGQTPFFEMADAYMEKAVGRHLEKQNRRRTAETLHAYGVQNRQSNVIHLSNVA